MNAEHDEPDWLVDGGDAVLLQDSARGSLRAETVQIERVMKRDVVLSDGTRLNRRKLQFSSGDWGPITRLVPLDDPRVAEVRSRIQIADAYRTAQSAVDDYHHSRVTASQVAAAWQRLADLTEKEQPDA